MNGEGIAGRESPQAAMRPKPRIALIAPGPAVPGGQGHQARILLQRLQAEGYRVTFLPVDPPFPRGFRWLRKLPYVRTLLNQALYLPGLLRIARADVVHVLSASYWSFLLAPAPAILLSRMLQKRSVLHYHSGEAEDHLGRWGILVHPVLRLADEIVVPSEYLRRIFESHGHRARMIRNMVETSALRYRQRSPLRPHLLSTRNLDSYYQVNHTLEAFALLKRSYPEASLTVAGSGAEERRLRRLAGSLGVDGIRFVGAVSPEEMPALYDAADIFVNSSILDNQPVSVLEAFAAGLPVVSTGPGDLPSMVRHGETGLLVPQGDPAAMARAVALLLGDPERALALARRARQEAEEYSWERVRARWQAVLTGRELGAGAGEAVPKPRLNPQS